MFSVLYVPAAMVHDSSVVGKYKAGFSECATEVSRYLATIDGLSHDVRLRMMQHLSHCVQKVELSKMAAASKSFQCYAVPLYVI